MHRTTKRLLLFLLIAAGASPSSSAAEPADLVLFGGKIVTLDRGEHVVAAMAVRGGKIVAVGSDKDISIRYLRWEA